MPIMLAQIIYLLDFKKSLYIFYIGLSNLSTNYKYSLLYFLYVVLTIRKTQNFGIQESKPMPTIFG